MIRAKAGDLLILGVDRENLRRLRGGQPIVVDLTDYGDTRRVLFMYGDTMTDIMRELEASGMKLPPVSPHIVKPEKPS